MQFLPQGTGGSGDGFKVNSIIAVRLSSDYDSLTLSGELTRKIGQDADLHYFGFDILQPYVATFLSYLTIGSDIATNGIQNSGGFMPSSVGETYWTIPGTSTSGNATSIFLQGPAIDFSPYTNPEILLFWNMIDLVQVWNHGTPLSFSDDIVTFNLSNPFPVSLNVQEYTAPITTGLVDTIAPVEVLLPSIAGPTTWNTLQWINPKDTDFDKVVIIRKVGTAPVSKDDGEKVYEGFEPNYVDVTGISGTHYFYSIFASDIAGNYSNGVSLDQVQH